MAMGSRPWPWARGHGAPVAFISAAYRSMSLCRPHCAARVWRARVCDARACLPLALPGTPQAGLYSAHVINLDAAKVVLHQLLHVTVVAGTCVSVSVSSWAAAEAHAGVASSGRGGVRRDEDEDEAAAGCACAHERLRQVWLRMWPPDSWQIHCEAVPQCLRQSLRMYRPRLHSHEEAARQPALRSSRSGGQHAVTGGDGGRSFCGARCSHTSRAARAWRWHSP